jgi:twitching motility protein PilT
MVITPAIQNLIRENKVYRIDSSIQTGRKHGMFLLDENLFKLWKEGLCEKEEVLMRAARPAELASKIAQAERGLLEEDEDLDDEEEEDEEDDEEEEDEEDEEEDDEDEDDDEPRRRRGR